MLTARWLRERKFAARKYGIIHGMEEKPRDFREGKLPLPVGKSDWEYVAAHNYCVDKTLFIREARGSHPDAC